MIEEIKAALKKISPFPWKWKDDELKQKNSSYDDSLVRTDSGAYPPYGADKEFIAKAPERLQWCVSRINELEEKRDSLKTPAEIILQNIRLIKENQKLKEKNLEVIAKTCKCLTDSAKDNFNDGYDAAMVEVDKVEIETFTEKDYDNADTKVHVDLAAMVIPPKWQIVLRRLRFHLFGEDKK